MYDLVALNLTTYSTGAVIACLSRLSFAFGVVFFRAGV